jgi:acyl-[acyl-carrier-protein]-phospholipid O-acyltransferase / long-chain-fatty-acid--[acyl-carrier-protein] ligase
MRSLVRWLLRLLYGFRAYNEAALNAPGPVLLLPNHVSWWDWLLIGVCLDYDWRFVTSSAAAEMSWIHKLIMVNRRTFPVDINSPYAVKHMAEYLQRGGRLVLFPEGRLSVTGSLMKLFDGTGFLIHKTHAKVITAYLRNARRLPYSRNPDRKQWFPRLSVHFSNPRTAPYLDHPSATEARTRLTDWARDQMVKHQFETELAFGPSTLPAAMVETARQWPSLVVLQDVTMQELDYRKILTGAGLLAAQWRRRLDPEAPRVGVLLPNVNATPVVMLSLWAANKVPAMLNYSSGTATMLSCARIAGLKQIITSQKFVQAAKLDLEPFKQAGIGLVFLEEVRANITGTQKLLMVARQRLRPGLPTINPQLSTHSPALILFTSGSEGEPKGVELTHGNVLANIRQMLSVIDLMETDRFFCALPLFHCFGLTVGLWLPLVRGVFVFLYPSPLHYRVVPSAFYNLNCTVFFGTNTFLSGYARKAHPYDFRAVRYLFAGAEKLQESTSTLWMRKFGVRVLEGYGVTECSPCVSVNLPIHPRQGSAGQFLPGIEYRLEPVEGIEPSPVPGPEAKVDAGAPAAQHQPADDPHTHEHDHDHEHEPDHYHAWGAEHHPSVTGRLFVRGPNVMRGYLNPEANAQFQALGGWYDTGDIARVDRDGFVHILGRLKRFAKVSGEMVSLAAVEDALANAFPQYGLRFAVAVITRPDEAKGERLMAVTNEPRLTLEEVREAVRARGLSNLAMPREIKVLHDLPRLATGKVNYRELQKLL